MAPERHWNKAAEKQWRSTFTRANMEGARKLHYELRHKGAEAVARAEKKRALAKMEQGVRSSVAGAFEAVTEQMLRPDMPFIGGDAIPCGRPNGESIVYFNTYKVVRRFDEDGFLASEERIEF